MMRMTAMAAGFAALLAAGTAGAETLAQRLAGPGSHVAATVALPYEALTLLIGQDVEEVYTGRAVDISRRLDDDRVDWTARLTGLATGPDGPEGFVVSATAEGRAEVTGRLIGLRLDETLRLRVGVDLVARPQFRENWTIALDVLGEATVRRAELSFFGVDIDLRSRLQPGLDDAFEAGLEEQVARLAERPVLRRAFRGVWRDACREVDALDGQGRFRPTAIAVTQPRFGDDGIEIAAVITADLLLGPRAEAPPCPPLPARLELLERS
ncbi:hypothetical protein OG2516_07315 [Oceanicola granulosus HTCC2516]|uniref:DUF4403 family protein n=1 Tax=Oceanicola granulosus (strain ATCC BAA-861 / DSM 15982 / KCTC 12143 / HTCC2516) TaxID=314256 RepID=Q2CBH1_OCEGH|nr:DUF4403 family protein [Oceanicola granulosus]EAR49992.1 hypothetical protein OG2516_07315 [Oceanicola granulosus HTCC2516]